MNQPDNTPRIYDVLEFRKKEHGLRYCYLHKVAAFTSQSAEQEFVRALLASPFASSASTSEFYVVNDQAGHHQHGAAVNFHVTGTEMACDPHLPITDEEHRRWIEIQTRSFRSEGELMPPAFRQITLPACAPVAAQAAVTA